MGIWFKKVYGYNVMKKSNTFLLKFLIFSLLHNTLIPYTSIPLYPLYTYIPYTLHINPHPGEQIQKLRLIE